MEEPRPGTVDKFPKPDELSKLLECPVCTEIPFPPINQCIQGHLICHICRNRLQICPECRSDFSTTRCFGIESIVNSSFFNCTYQENGCTQLIKGEVLQQHQSSCPYRNGKLEAKAPIYRVTYPVPNPIPRPRPAGTFQSTKVPSIQSKTDGNSVGIGGSHLWKSCSSSKPIPEGVILGGMQGGCFLFVARAPYAGGIYPGGLQSIKRIVGLSDLLVIPVIVSDGYEVLTAEPGMLRWEEVEPGTLPANPVPGGLKRTGEVLYIARNRDKNAIKWISKATLRLDGNQRGLPKLEGLEVLVKTELGIATERSLIEA